VVKANTPDPVSCQLAGRIARGASTKNPEPWAWRRMAFQARGPRKAPRAAQALTVRIDAPLGLIRSTTATATAASSAEIAAPYTMVDQLSMVMPLAQDSAPMMLRTILTARTDGLKQISPAED